MGIVNRFVPENKLNEGLDSKISVPQPAEVGQTIVVEEVDKNGKPTKWNATNILSNEEKWELIQDITFEEAVSTYMITEDMDGNPLNLKALDFYMVSVLSEGETTVSQKRRLLISDGSDENWSNGERIRRSFNIGKDVVDAGDVRYFRTIIEVDEVRGAVLINSISSFNATSVLSMVYKNTYTEVEFPFEQLDIKKISKIGVFSSSGNFIGKGSRIRIVGIKNK